RRAFFRAQRFEAAPAFQRLAVEVVQARALDFGGLRGLGAALRMGVPMSLPFGDAVLGGAHLLGGLRGPGVRRFQTRLAVRQRRAQRLDLITVGADVLVEFGVGLLGFDARAFQALAEFAVVLDLLLDARNLAADAIDLALNLVEPLGRGMML